MRVLFFFITLLLSLDVGAQNNATDSLLNLVQNSKYDTVKIDASNELAQVAGVNINNLDTALYYTEKAFKMSISINYQKGKAKALSNKGVIAYYRGQYEAAMNYMIESLAIMKEIRDYPGAAALSNNLGVLSDAFGRNQQALDLYNESLLYRNKTLEKGDLTQKERNNTIKGIASSQVNIGNIKETFGKYDEALEHYSIAFEKYQLLNDTAGMALVYSNIGLIFQFRGEYAKAVAYFQSALQMNEQINSKEGIATARNNIGNIFLRQGNLDKAMENYKIAYTNAEDLAHNQRKIESGINMGVVHQSRNEYEKAIEKFSEALELSEAMQDVNNMSFCYNNLGTVYQKAEMFEEALQYYNASMEISEATKDYRAPILTEVNIATCKDLTGHHDEAYNHFMSALEKARALGAQHEIVFALKTIYINFSRFRSIEESYQYLKQLIEEREKEIQINYYSLSEDEKIVYLNTLNADLQLYFDFASRHQKQFKEVGAKSYDLALKSKGLSLKSVTAMRNAIQSSSDEKLLNTYDQWIELKEEISHLYGQGEDIKQKQNEANQLEKQLIANSQAFNEFSKRSNTSWKAIQEKLSADEAAIEFVLFENRADIENIENYYAAIILRKTGDPKMITICKEAQLKEIFGTFQGNNLQFINQIYGTSASSNTQLYELIWKPIEKHLDGIEKIHLSPIGILHKVSFSAIGTDKDQYLTDLYQINIVTSTSQIHNSISEYNEKLKYLVMGGVKYNSDTTQKEVWRYLDGSLDEVQQIAKNIGNQTENYKLFTGKDASESNFMQNVQEADIIHIATHGFFFPDPKKLRQEIEENTEFKEEIAFRGTVAPSVVEKSLYANFAFLNNKNPLMRSGIALALANDVWQRSPFQKGEDGVLTAQEASLLDLRKTKLVVLSACETGLGDIIGAEGVFGLQRGFKIAGVKNMIISLWKVPDKETSEFMQTFYKNLNELNDIKEAFSLTQKAMRKKYDPYFWAAFVLVQ